MKKIPAEAGESKLSALFIENDPVIVGALSLYLKIAGFTVTSAASLEEVLSDPEAGRPDVLVCDYRLGGRRTGVEAIRHLREVWETALPAILLTGDTAPAWLHKAEALGCPVLYKPVESEELVGRILRLVADEDSGG